MLKVDTQSVIAKASSNSHSRSSRSRRVLPFRACTSPWTLFIEYGVVENVDVAIVQNIDTMSGARNGIRQNIWGKTKVREYCSSSSVRGPGMSTKLTTEHLKAI